MLSFIQENAPEAVNIGKGIGAGLAAGLASAALFLSARLWRMLAPKIAGQGATG